MTLSTATVPYTGPYSKDGNGLHKGPTALALKRAMSRLGFLPWEPDKWDDAFNQKLEDALDRWNGGGANGYATGRYDKIRAAKIPSGKPHAGEYALDSVCIGLIADEHAARSPALPALGPMVAGGTSILDRDCTHATSGIPLYPAFDDVFYQGAKIIAPEKLTVTRQSSSSPGHAFYADGASKLRYWFGHLDRTPSVGRVFAKGELIGLTCAVSTGGGPHVHVAVNVEKYPGFGAGKQLKHHTNYTHGAPTIRAQLEAAS